MAGSIGILAQEVLNEVKKDNLVKLAEYRIIQTASARPAAKTELGQLLQKVANLLRSKPEEMTVGDIEDFLDEVSHAS